MTSIVLTYRLPSLAVLTKEDKPPITFVTANLTFTVWPPVWDEALSIRGGWIEEAGVGQTNCIYGDVLRVKVERPDLPDEPRGQLFSDASPTLQAVVKRLAEWLQVEAKQWWMGYTPIPMEWFGVPVFWNEFRGDDEQRVWGSRTGRPLIPYEFLVTAERWRAVGMHLELGEEVPMPRLLLLESHGFRLAGNFRSAALSCAMACEVAVKTFILEVGRRKDPVYSYITNKLHREVSLFDQLTEIVHFVTGEDIDKQLRQLKEEPVLGVKDLQQLFEVRNKVAHEGRAYRRSNNQVEELTDQRLREFQAVTDRFIGYLVGQLTRLAAL